MLQLIGNLVKDAKTNTVNGDKQVINFTIALNDGYTNKEGQYIEQTTYVECAFWSKADLAKHLTTGKLVEVYGRIYPDAYITKEGEAAGVIRCTLNRLKFHNSKNASKEPTSTATPKGTKKGTRKAVTEPVTEPTDDLPF